MPKNKPPQKPTNLSKNKENTIPQKEWLNEDTRRDLRRRAYVSIAKTLGYPATDVWVKGRFTSSKYFQIAVRTMSWSKNQMENYTVQNWNNCHREPLLLPSQESPPSIISGSGEVSRDNMPLL